jgi:hypothetical protein
MTQTSKPDEILSLLRSKTRCLERLMAATHDFLKVSPEALLSPSVNGQDALSIYEKERETIVKTVELHDRRISDLIASLGDAEKNPSLAQEASKEMSAIEKLITHVFNADDVVFERIRQAQEHVSRMASESRKNADILSRFKSAPNKTGDGMDTTL